MKKLIYLCLILVSVFDKNVDAQSTLKNNILWIDPLKNISDITSRSSITDVVNRAATSGFQGIALGIKTNTGQVLFESEIAPRLLEWKGQSVPQDFDIIREFADQAAQKDLIFYALYPIFAGGDMVERKGLLYNEHPEWQSYVYVVENEEPEIMPITQWAYGTIAYINPINEAAQNYEITVINEFFEEYSVGGFIFDKLRFYGIEADFSDETRKAFERFLGGSVSWWPQDIFEWQFQNEKWEIVPRDKFLDWVNFRARETKNIARRLVQAVKNNDPTLQVGNFVGSWYPTYYEYGVNWASADYKPEGNWSPRNYGEASLVGEFDYTVTGSFFPRVTMQNAEAEGAEWWMSVEGGAELAKEVIGPTKTPIYGALLVEQFRNDEEKFKLALKTALEKSDGIVLTDLSHIQKHNYWAAITSVLTGKVDRRIIR